MNLKSITIGSVALLAISGAIVSACGSSSSSAPPNQAKGDDGSPGTTDAAETINDASPSQISDSGSCSISAASCATGLTCCFSETTFSGTCTAPSACTSSIQLACSSAASCQSGQVCCAEISGLDGSAFDAAAFDASAFDAAGFDAAGFDAAGFNFAEAGFGNFTYKVTCESTCGAGVQQLCTSTTECKTPGYTCQTLAFGESVCAAPPDAAADN